MSRVFLGNLVSIEKVGGTWISRNGIAGNVGILSSSISNDYHWDDTAGNDEGFILRVPSDSAYRITEVHVYGNDRYPLSTLYIDPKGSSSFYNSNVTQSKPMLVSFSGTDYVRIRRTTIKDQAVNSIHVYGVALDRYLIADTSTDDVYTVKSSFYDTSKKCYTPIPVKYSALTNTDISKYGFSKEADFTNTITIGEETFRPIDKFKDIPIRFISLKSGSFPIKGYRTKSSMVVSHDDINTERFSNIDHIDLLSSLSGEASLKIAVSIDKGSTWLTNSEGNWSPMNISIPLKPLQEFNEEDTANWDAAKLLISSDGIDVGKLTGIDFNLLNATNIRFAYVMSFKKPTDVATINTLKILFDAKGYFKKIKESDIDISLLSNSIEFTTSQKHEIVKLNISSSQKLLNNGDSENLHKSQHAELLSRLNKLEELIKQP